MKLISEYITEQLSKSNLDRLEDLVRQGIVNDDNFEDIYNEVLKISKVAGLDRSSFDEFFKKHGLSELRWGRGNDAFTELVRMFAKNSNVDTLKEIVTKDGAKSVHDMPFTGNIFDTPREQGWEDEAKTLALMVNSKSANAGPCELLLKFMLREGNGRVVGDVGIDQDEMEVKAITKSGKSTSGGHAAGHKGGIQPAYSIYYAINRLAFNEDSLAQAKKDIYFQNAAGFKELNKRLKDSGTEMDKFLEIVLDALLYQYNFKEFSDDGLGLKGTAALSKIDYRGLRESFLKYMSSYTSKDQITDMKEFINAVGAVQLYLYSIIEGFDYLFLVYIDKTESDPNSGKYVMFRDIASGKCDLSDISIVLKHMTFGNLDSATSTQGRTGKMNFRKH